MPNQFPSLLLYVDKLARVLATWVKNLCKDLVFVEIILTEFTQSLRKLVPNIHFKNGICHHKFKSNARSNGYTLKEAKTSRIGLIQKNLQDFPNK